MLRCGINSVFPTRFFFVVIINRVYDSKKRVLWVTVGLVRGRVSCTCERLGYPTLEIIGISFYGKNEPYGRVVRSTPPNRRVFSEISARDWALGPFWPPGTLWNDSFLCNCRIFRINWHLDGDWRDTQIWKLPEFDIFLIKNLQISGNYGLKGVFFEKIDLNNCLGSICHVFKGHVRQIDVLTATDVPLAVNQRFCRNLIYF